MGLLKCSKRWSDRKAAVDLFAIFFGIGSWIGINSTYLQLPLLVASAPEGWSLPSYIVVVVQVANIGPILYTTIQRFSPSKMNDSYLIYGIFVCGITAACLMALFHGHTIWVGDTERSIPMLLIVFLFALVGCTSSVLFMPYMGRFRDIYLITYLIGEGLSGFLPSIVTLIQGVGGNAKCVERVNSTAENPLWELFTPSPRFGTSQFFIFVAVLSILSILAFALLDYHPISRGEHAAVVIRDGNNYEYQRRESDRLSGDGPKRGAECTLETPHLERSTYYSLLLLMLVICMFCNGVFPSIQSYSCLPYGNVAYHLTVTLSSIANPVACFLAVFMKRISIRSIIMLVMVAIIIGTYTLTTAVLSPTPPLMTSVLGEILVVISWTLLNGIFSFIRLAITTIVRNEGGMSLVWIGVSTQVGSFIGAITIFVLIQTTHLFTSYVPDCDGIPS